jgi:hypothetical protein
MTIGKPIIAGLVLLALGWAAAAPSAAAGPDPVDLKTASRFAILSGAAITSPGGGCINGDAGASPIAGSAIGLTSNQVNGVIYVVGAAGQASDRIQDPFQPAGARRPDSVLTSRTCWFFFSLRTWFPACGLSQSGCAKVVPGAMG